MDRITDDAVVTVDGRSVRAGTVLVATHADGAARLLDGLDGTDIRSMLEGKLRTLITDDPEVAVVGNGGPHAGCLLLTAG